MKHTIYALIFLTVSCFSCSGESIDTVDPNVKNVVIPEESNSNEGTNSPNTIKLLSLGDSYTIGESVCETCKFPEQLKVKLNKAFNPDRNIELKVLAKTGWTTTSLINAVNQENLSNNFDLVTLLIGVNNQYQDRDFSLYEDEFPKLVDIAVQRAKGNKTDVIVISIPDYAYTPFGNGDTQISTEIDKYNAFAERYCQTHDITYINITDITRMGLDTPELVASDGLHPSELAYSEFVESILPYAVEKLK